MKLPFGNKKEKKEEKKQSEYMLALDIGTTYVKAVIFKKSEGKVYVKGYAKVKQQSNAMRGAMIVNIKKVISTCDLAIGEALSTADKIIGKEKDIKGFETPTPNQVVLGIAGEFVKGVAIMANYEREEPREKITKDEIDDVVESVKEQAFEGVIEDISDEIGVDPDNVVEIGSVVNSTYIDGIKVDDPEGFTGREVSYRVFTTFAPSIHLDSLKEVVRALNLEISSIEVEPYTIARALRGARDENFSGIIIDIGGGTTDVALVDTGGVVGTKMFAYGGDVFTKRLETDFNKEYRDAEEMKMDYSDLKLSDKQAKDIKKSFWKDIPVWVEGVELALGDFEDVEKYPSDIYLCGGGSSLPDIKEGLIEHPWLNVLAFDRFPKTSFIFPNQLEGLVDNTKKMIDPSDIAPAALALSTLE
ncbi:MAG TPA: cell division protein FtsA [Candidatus Dojkabacteria bacterium]|jgi:cell division protein FtsA